MDHFGELMLYGTFTVLKGDGSSKDQEKEVGAINFFFGQSGNVHAPRCFLTFR